MFDDVEVRDFAGPFEMFTVTGRHRPVAPFQAILVSERSGPVTARGNLVVQPHTDFIHCPALDMVLVPGGGGHRADVSAYRARLQQQYPVLRAWLLHVARPAQRVMSVCSGVRWVQRRGLSLCETSNPSAT